MRLDILPSIAIAGALLAGPLYAQDLSPHPQVVAVPQAVLPPPENLTAFDFRPCAFVLMNDQWYSISMLLPSFSYDYQTILAAASGGKHLRILLDAPANVLCNGTGVDAGTVYPAFWAPLLMNP
jgi:hypothetical protein